MIYFMNRELDDNELIVYEIQKVYGVGKFISKNICKQIGISQKAKVRDIQEGKFLEMYRLLSKRVLLDFELRYKSYMYMQKKIELKSYKGLRYSYGLPANGQRTKTNGRTAKKLIVKQLKIR